MFSGETKFIETKKNVEQEIVKIYLSFDEVSKSKNLNLKEMDKAEFNKFNNGLPFDLYIYEDNKLVFWNENKAIPDLNINLLTNEAKLITLKNGYYIALKKTVGNKEYVALSLLRNSYSLVNKYLNNSFSNQFAFYDGDVILPSQHSSGEAINAPNGKPIFKILHVENESTQLNYLRLFISVAVLFFLYLFLIQFVTYLSKIDKVFWGSISFFVLGISWILLIKYVPFEFKKMDFFNPEIYGSELFVSLGLMSAHILLFYSWAHYLLINVVKGKIRSGVFLQVLISILLVVGYVFSNILFRSIVLDSVINYGAKNLLLLNLYPLVGLIIALFNGVTFVFIAILFVFIFKNSRNRLVVLVLVSLVVLSILYYLNFANLAISLSLLMFLFIYFLDYYIIRRERKNTIIVIVVSIFFLVLLVSSVFRIYTLEKNDTAKKTIAFKKSRQRDVTAEDLYSSLEKKIIEDEFIISFFQNPMMSYKDIYKRMTFRYFGGYLSKYDVSIVAFSIEGKPIKFNSKETLEQYYELINKSGEPTINENLFFIQDEKNQFAYVSLLQISNKENVVGTLAIKISPKTYDISSVYPELLLQGKNSIVKQYKEDYGYAIYDNNVLIDQSDEFAYLSKLSENLPDYYIKDGYNHSVFKINDTKKIIISTKEESIFDMFSVFSFVLCYYFVIGFIVTVVYFKLTNKENKQIFNFSFRKRINIAMLSLVVLSFFIIGLATVSYFSNQYNDYHQKRLIRKQKSILSSLNYVIEKNSLENAQDFSNYFLNSLSPDLLEMSDIHKMDINIFDLEGKLIVSSQDGIFTSGLLSQVINPSAFVLLNGEMKSIVTQDERIGNLKYLSIYVPVLNSNGEKMAFLNIPYFAKEKNLNQDISNFMISLINVYVLLLIIAGIVAFFVSNSITNPLKIIGEKIKEISLSKRNAFIEWQSDDEIGALVHEYNRMILQLDESAKLLASTERDTAWREMAKQIAHEIKNPLTPMKLSIQHMQRALKEDKERGLEIAERVSKTLIEQINNLSDIATAFSSFAKMPKGDREEIDLVEVINTVVDLFEIENIEIVKKYLIKNGKIFADKNQLISVFNNLVKNALQATEDKENAEVVVKVYRENDFYIVSIKDNGVGISEDEIEKIFIPNFTTKSSGTGLGLAISKKIVEGLNGNIWFESKENEFTIFYVKIPILN